MTLREQVAQLVMIPCYGEAPNARTRAYRDFVRLVRDVRVGGLIVVNRVQNGTVRSAEPYAMAAFFNRMQRIARVPLVVAGDFERGASMRVAGTTKFPHLMAYGAAGDTALTRQLGEATAREARALGVQWVFAPVADVNNNPDNPIINIRSFGEDPDKVSAHVRAFIEGAHASGGAQVLTTAKHFPGHGDTAVDSHMGLPSLGATRERIEQVELKPFRAAIAAGVDSIMSAHMAVPAFEPQEVPATVSAAVMTKLLRDELGFTGIVSTDAMDMAGLSKQFPPGEAAVRAIEAGADLLLMPPKPDEAVRAVMAAVQSGRISRKRLQASVGRLLAAKVRVGLDRKRLVDLEAISDQIDAPEYDEQAQSVADRAVTLLKNRDNAVPVKETSKACFLALVEGRYGQQGRQFVEEVRKRAKDSRSAILDATMPEVELEQVRSRMADCQTYVVATYVTFAAYRGYLALGGALTPFLEKLIAGQAPVVMIALGNPYLVRSFPNVAAYIATFSNVPVSETAAVKAVLGEIPFQGRSPVKIPGLE